MNKFTFPDLPTGTQSLIIDAAQNNVPVLGLASTYPENLHVFLEAARQAERDYLARSMIHRKNTRQEAQAVLHPQTSAIEIARWQAAVSNSFFLVENDGARVSVFNNEIGAVVLGGYKPAMYERLDKKNRFPQHITDAHTDHVVECLEVGPGTLICETGAGLDCDRLSRMHKKISDQDGYLICHDIAPLLAKVGRERLPEIPYVALPPFERFLGKTLAAYEGRKVLSMKNTLTSLRGFEVDALIESMKRGDVDRLVVTQSIAPNMALYFEDAEKAIDNWIKDLSIKAARERTPDGDPNNITAVMLVNQTKCLTYTILLEILYQNLADQAAKHGYYVEIATESSDNCDLSEEEITAFMDDKEIPYQDLFREGLFNQVTFNPTAILYDLERSIPPRTLRVKSSQIHLTLARKTKPTIQSVIRIGGRTINSLAIPAFAVLKSEYPQLNFAELAIDPSGQDNFDDTAAENALAVVFEAVGKIFGIQVVRQYCDTPFEREMYKSFGIY